MRALAWLRRLAKRKDAQDMVEYALVAGFLAVAAGATLPRIGDDVAGIFARLGKQTAAAANTGGASPTGATRNR